MEEFSPGGQVSGSRGSSESKEIALPELDEGVNNASLQPFDVNTLSGTRCESDVAILPSIFVPTLVPFKKNPKEPRCEQDEEVSTVDQSGEIPIRQRLMSPTRNNPPNDEFIGTQHRLEQRRKSLGYLYNDLKGEEGKVKTIGRKRRRQEKKVLVQKNKNKNLILDPLRVGFEDNNDTPPENILDLELTTKIAEELRKVNAEEEALRRKKHAALANVSSFLNGDKASALTQKRAQRTFNQRAKVMKKELGVTVEKEKKLADRIKADGELAVSQLPVQFLSSLNMKDFVMERGAKTINQVLKRLWFLKVDQGFQQWVEVTEKLRQIELEANLLKSRQCDGFKTFAKVRNRIEKASLTKAVDRWVEVCLSHPWKLERFAAAIQIQRVYHGHRARGHYRKLYTIYRAQLENSAVLIMQRCVRARLARNITHRLKRQKHITECAFRVQSFFRTIVAKNKFRRRLFQVMEQRHRNEMATKINKVSRGFLGRRRASAVRFRKLQQVCAIQIQTRVRIVLAKKSVSNLRMILFEEALEEVNKAMEVALLHVAATKIQATYARYRKHAIKDAAAWTALEAVVDAEEFVASLVIQQKFREFQIGKMVRDLQQRVDELVVTSAIQLQTFSRGQLAKKKVKTLKVEKRAVRIAEARKRAAARTEMDRVEEAIQNEQVRAFLSNLKCDEKEWERIKANMRKHVFNALFSGDSEENILFRAFSGWKMIYDDIQRLKAKELAEQQLARALKFLGNRTQIKAYGRWVQYVIERKHNKVLALKALNFLRLSTYNKYMLKWSESVENTKLYKQKLVKIFLNCLPVEVYNSKRQLAFVKLSKGMFDVQFRSRIMCRWISHMSYRRQQMEDAGKWYHKRWTKRAPQLVIGAWKALVQRRRFKRWQMKVAREHHERVIIIKGVGSWKLYLIYLVEMRKKHALAEAHFALSLQKGSIKRWKQNVDEIIHMRKINRMAELHAVRQRKRNFCQRWRQGVQIKKEKRGKKHKAVAHFNNGLLRRVMISFFETVHATVLERRRKAAIKIQCRWRIRQAKLTRFNLWTRRQYFLEKEAEREEIARRKQFVIDRTLRKVKDDEEMAQILDQNAMSNGILVILFTAPWVCSRTYYNIETTCALAGLKLSENNLITFLRADLGEISPKMCCFRCSVRSFPVVLPFWKGKAYNEGVNDEIKYFKTAVQRLHAVLKDIPVLGLGVNLDICKPEKDEAMRVGKLVNIVSICTGKAQAAESQAANCVQGLIQTHRSNATLKKCKQLVRETLENDAKEKQEELWTEHDYFPYKIPDNRKGDHKKTKFYFNHKTLVCTWDKPKSFNDTPLLVNAVTQTGHFFPLEGLVKGSTVEDVLCAVGTVRGVKPEFMKIGLRPDGVYYDSSIIAGENNKGYMAKLGIGATVQVFLDDRWQDCQIVNVYTDESVDIELLEEPEIVEGESKDEESDTQEQRFRSIIPRSEIRVKHLNPEHDQSIFQLGFRDNCVVEVLELDDLHGVYSSKEVKHLAYYGIRCQTCDTQSASVFCRECRTCVCEGCFLQKHLVLEEDEELNDFDRYILQKQRSKHHPIPVGNIEIANQLAEIDAEAKRKAALEAKQSARGSLFKRTSTMPTLDEQGNAVKLELCSECEVRKAETLCHRCTAVYCNLCFSYYHEKGEKVSHGISATPYVPQNVTDGEGTEQPEHRSLHVTVELFKEKKWKSRYLEALAEAERLEEERIRQAELKAAEEIIGEAFKRYDVDDSGTLDASELGSFLREEVCEPVTEEEVDKAILQMDENGNGLIEYEELLHWFVDLSKQDGRDGAKMKLLRMNLQAKKRARLIKNQINGLVPRDQLSNTKKYLEMQAQKWKDRRIPVPGYPNAAQLRMSDFEDKVHLFQRYARREFNIACTLVDTRRKKLSDIKKRNTRLAFESVFLPLFNEGKLGPVYYNDGIHITHHDQTYLQYWDDPKNCFLFKNLETGKVQKLNPVLEEKHADEIRKAFEKYDIDGSGYLDSQEVEIMLEEELCVKLSKSDLDTAMELMDEDHDGEVTYDDFLLWYTRGIDTGDRGMSNQLRAKRRYKKLRESSSNLKKNFSEGTSTAKRKLTKSALLGAQNLVVGLKAVGKGKLYRDMVAEGWNKADIQKAIYRCKDETGEEKKQAVIAWLEANAVHEKKDMVVADVEVEKTDWVEFFTSNGWNLSDVQKAMFRTKNLKEEEKQAAIQEWLEKNALNEKKKVKKKK